MAKRDLQVKRDQLDVGCDVLVTRAGSDHKYRGVIINMYSTMAAVRLERSRKVEMIALTKLTRVEDEQVESATPPPPKPLALKQSPPPKLAIVEPTPQPSDDVTAWLEMGKGLAATLESQIAELNQEAQDLRSTASELMRQADETEKRRQVLEGKLNAIRSIAS